MVTKLLVSAPTLSGGIGVALLEAMPQNTGNLVLQAIVAVASLFTTWLSHKKVKAHIKEQKKQIDEKQKG